ncbi:MAG: RNA polymerase sigma factor (sigma-70 family) [Planctomycetaceae bacterium]|jgi:RNA polymerase sigma factor (sigma-70 family)
MQTSPETRPSLLLRLRNPQDEQAWREFLEIYEPLIERLSRRRGLQHADARELVQEVLLAVSGAIDRWDPDEAKGSFRGWLSTITRNLTINLLKREGRHTRGTGDSEFARLMNEQPDPVGENTALFDLEYRRRLFQFAAEHVQEQFEEATWQAFWKTSVEQQPLVDVCEELGLSRGAIYVARSRVMAKLRIHIEKLESEV